MNISYCLFFIICGLIIGIIIRGFWENSKQLSGFLEIDHETGLCRFKVTNEKLSNPKIKRIIFVVNHDGKIPDELLDE